MKTFSENNVFLLENELVYPAEFFFRKRLDQCRKNPIMTAVHAKNATYRKYSGMLFRKSIFKASLKRKVQTVYIPNGKTIAQ